MDKNEESERTELNTLGEFELIERIKKRFPLSNNTSVLGIGDDAAVIKPEEDKELLISTDMLVEGVHFDLMFQPLKHLGYKAVAVNVSDIAAMNGTAQQITVSLGLSNRFSLEAVEELYEGIRHACSDYNVDLVGGDTTSSYKGLIISVTAVGQVEKGRVSLRSGAREGDVLCATGDLGSAFIGLKILQREKEVFLAAPTAQPKLEDYNYQVGRYLKPQARTDIIHELSELDVVPTSMIDISDGLSSEILHLCKASGVGAAVFEEHIPLDAKTNEVAASELNISPLTCVLNGGDEYELLFTIRQEDHEKLKYHRDIHFIGYMTAPELGKKLQLKSGQVIDLKAQGWKHF